MNPLDLWPYAILLGLALFAFCLLGPLLSGLMLIILILIILGNLLSPR